LAPNVLGSQQPRREARILGPDQSLMTKPCLCGDRIMVLAKHCLHLFSLGGRLPGTISHHRGRCLGSVSELFCPNTDAVQVAVAGEATRLADHASERTPPMPNQFRQSVPGQFLGLGFRRSLSGTEDLMEGRKIGSSVEPVEEGEIPIAIDHVNEFLGARSPLFGQACTELDPPIRIEGQEVPVLIEVTG
jgi:hypothetical protein